MKSGDVVEALEVRKLRFSDGFRHVKLIIVNLDGQLFTFSPPWQDDEINTDYTKDNKC